MEGVSPNGTSQRGFSHPPAYYMRRKKKYEYDLDAFEYLEASLGGSRGGSVVPQPPKHDQHFLCMDRNQNTLRGPVPLCSALHTKLLGSYLRTNSSHCLDDSDFSSGFLLSIRAETPFPTSFLLVRCHLPIALRAHTISRVCSN